MARSPTLLNAEAHDRISAAVIAAEAQSDGEIGTIIAAQSDDYADWAVRWSLVAALLWLLAVVIWPDRLSDLIVAIRGGWGVEPSIHDMLLASLIGLLVCYALARLALMWRPLRLAVTPWAVKRHRVRTAAVQAFRIAVEARTRAATGVLIYLSLVERRAEIVAEASIHARVPEERWAEAMALLIDHIRAGRVADGIVATVETVGAIIAAEFPRSHDDRNELPDRLIEL